MFAQRSFSVTACIATAVAAFSQLTYADTSPLKAEMKVFQIVDIKKNAKKELKATDQVKPKEVLEYQVQYSNVSKDSLKGLKLNLPIPTHVSYTGTALPKNTFASVDGVKFEKTPLTRVVDGKKVMVPLNEYRVLQWHVSELKPKQTISVNAQVRVNAAE